MYSLTPLHSLQTFSLQQTDGEHIKSRIFNPPTSPSAHIVGKNVSWDSVFIGQQAVTFDHDLSSET